MVSKTEQRKIDHIKLCVEKDVAFDKKTTLLEDVELNYKTLPEISLEEVNLSTQLLGKEFSFPFLASAITGGAQVSKKINFDIAKACQEFGIGMGLGSMRAMLENPKIKDTYNVKSVAPEIFVAGNIGVAQLRSYSTQEVNSVIESLNLDALAIHLNAAQEAMQPEGDVNFSNLIEKIDEFSKEVCVPVYAKEVGHGISFEVASKLEQTNIQAIDVQGAGGTSWTRVDALRHKGSFGSVFRDFGLPTAVSIIETKNAFTKQIIASGGIRNGLDAVKGIILGASMSGAAMPVLQAQQKSYKSLQNFFSNFKNEMEITSFLLGCKNIEELHRQNYVVLGKLKEWLNQ